MNSQGCHATLTRPAPLRGLGYMLAGAGSLEPKHIA
jgi:hypothetical protein